MADGKPGRGSDQFPLRLPDGMRDRLKQAAAANNRSMNAEIVSMLERYDSLAGEVDAVYQAAGCIASEIDGLVGPDPNTGLLTDLLAEVLHQVDERGGYDRGGVYQRFTLETAKRLDRLTDGAVRLPNDLRERIADKARLEARSVSGEVITTLKREYPPIEDMMHVHLDNIRHALDLYERSTNPTQRLQLQQLVEEMTKAGHSLEITWDEDDET